jgi:hypothetical protein
VTIGLAGLVFPLVFSKVAKVANFCTRGVGDLAGQKLVSMGDMVAK